MSISIMTANLNGIRAAQRKGFFEWFEAQKPDVLCIQETKAQRGQLEGGPYFPDGYHAEFVDAEKKGYSGVALMNITGALASPRSIPRAAGSRRDSAT
jgi:exodeoxyribonuclease-3